MGYSRFERNREVPQSPTVFMDPNDPRSHGEESHNGPAAEVEPAYLEQDSSQFQTPGTANNMSTVLKIALALAAFAQNAIAFVPATRIAAPRTGVAENQMVRHSYDYQAYSPGDYGGIMGAAVVDYLSGPTEDGSDLIVSQLETSSMGVSYTIFCTPGDYMSNDSYQRSAPDSRKWSSVIADPTAFAKKIDDVKKTAISEDLSGRRIVEQDDGVGVAVCDLPPETHVGIVIGSSDSLYQNILDEWVNTLHRYQVKSS